MRSVSLIITCILFVATTAAADPTDLVGGALIVHYPPQPSFTETEYCDYYGEVALTDGADQINRIDNVSTFENPDIWYIVAAFQEDKIMCGVQFGFNDYDPDVWTLTGWGPCPADCLIIEDGDWPGPVSGATIHAIGEPWAGNYLPVCYFEGFTYLASEQDDFTPTLISIINTPSRLGALNICNCEAPSGIWSVEAGALGVFTDGVAVYPAILGACCYEDGHCVETIEEYCNYGTYHHEIPCDPNPCPQPVVRACCDEADNCTLTTELDCEGIWLADETSCEPNPCIYSPAEPPSWGEIKTLYR